MCLLFKYFYSWDVTQHHEKLLIYPGLLVASHTKYWQNSKNLKNLVRNKWFKVLRAPYNFAIIAKWVDIQNYGQTAKSHYYIPIFS